MALTQITYNDKSNYQSSSLANEYKVSASDLNEIKSVVNGAIDQLEDTITYSTAEKKIGTWNGEDYYRTVVSFTGATTTHKNVAHNIANIKKITRLEGIATAGSGYVVPIPMEGTSDIYGGNKIIFRVNDTYIQIQATTDYSAYTFDITIEYTKTT